MTSPKVSVLILNWNQKFETAKCVASVLKSNYSNHIVTIIDNGSDDGSVSFFQENFPSNVNILSLNENLGYCRGFNKGIEASLKKNADYVMLINNDCIIDEKCLSELVKVGESTVDSGFVSGKVFFYERPNIFQTVGKKTHRFAIVGDHIGGNEIDSGQFEEIEARDFIDDVFILINREVIEKVGIFNPDYFMYREEADWQIRAKNHGFKITFAPKAKAWHKVSYSSGGGATNLNTYYLVRNQFLLLKNHGDKFQKLIFLLWFFFYSMPKKSLNLIINKRYFLRPYLRGSLSGFKYFLGQVLA